MSENEYQIFPTYFLRHCIILLFLNGAFKDVNSYSILLYDDVRAVYNVSHYWCRSHDAYFILVIEQNSWLNIKLFEGLTEPNVSCLNVSIIVFLGFWLLRFWITFSFEAEQNSRKKFHSQFNLHETQSYTIYSPEFFCSVFIQKLQHLTFDFDIYELLVIVIKYDSISISKL